MPIFYFNLSDHTVEKDDEGTELSSFCEARAEAIKFAGNYLGDNPNMLDDGATFKVQVTDADRKPLFSVVITIDEAGPI